MDNLLLVVFFGLLSAHIWAQDKPKLILQDGHAGKLVTQAILKDGLEAVTVSEDGTVKHWDVPERRVLRTIYDKKEYPLQDTLAQIESSVVLEANDEVVTLDIAGVVRRFKISTGEMMNRFTSQAYPAVVLSDGAYLYLPQKNKLQKLSFEGKVLGEFQNPVGEMSWNEHTLSLSGSTLTAGYGDTLYVLDTDALKLRAKLPLDSRSVAVISPDQTSLAIAGHETFSVRDLSNGQTLWEVDPNELFQISRGRQIDTMYYTPIWSESGDLYFTSIKTANNDPKFTLLKRKGKELIALPLIPDRPWLTGFAELANGTQLHSYVSGGFSIVEASGKETEFGAQTAFASVLCLSPDGEQLFLGSREGTVTAWDIKQGRQGKSYQGLSLYIGRIRLSPDGSKLLGSNLSHGDICVWDVKSGTLLSKFQVQSANKFGTGVSEVFFLDDSRYIVSSTENGRALVVDAESGKEVDSFELGKKRIQGMALSPRRDRAAFLSDGNTLTELSLVNKRDRVEKQVRERVNYVGLAYSEDGQRLYVGNSNGQIFRWDIFEPKAELVAFGPLVNQRYAAFFPRDNGLEVVSKDSQMSYLDKSGKLVLRTNLGNKNISAPLKVNEDLILVNSRGDSVVFYNPKDGSYLGELVQFDGNQGWVAFNSKGQFDGNSHGFGKLAFELGGDIYELPQFFNDYFTPGLLSTMFPASSKPELNSRSALALTTSNLKKPPVVEILSPTSGTVLSEPDFEVKVKVTAQGSGSSGAALYHNGHRLPDSNRKTLDSDTYLFTVKAVKGVNDVRATAFNASGDVESRRARLRVVAPDIEARNPRLHLLAVGVDEYISGLRLKFAEDDATSVAKLFTSSLYDEGERIVLTNAKATRGQILDSIQKIAEVSEPQDALVLYLAGHGTVIGEDYYFLPHDADVISDQALAVTAISSETLAKTLSGVPATKQMLVLDSCRSGKAVGVIGKYLAARSGLEEIRSQKMLARTSGTFLIAATKAEEFAYEVPELGHGVLTYAMLNALGVIGEPGQGTTTANGLLQSVSERVPDLSEKYHGVRQQVIQYSSGQDFPLTTP